MIDFRSDTVTKPTQAMRDFMIQANVGDDVYHDDPTVNNLEQWAAERHGFEAALLTTSGTQANLLALLSHCQRGEEYLCGQLAHNYKYEAGGAAVLGSIQPQPIDNENDGSLCFNKLVAKIKPDDFHFARTKLLSLENTINGKVLSMAYMAQAREFVNVHHLKLHLDGARIYNAATYLNVDVKDICHYFDSVSICLSKGLGAPIGSLLLGNKTYIKEARRWRKMLGGGMRQAGIIAAAGHYALENNVTRLQIDHDNATYLAQKLNYIDGFTVDIKQVQTNMVFVKTDPKINQNNLVTQLKQKNILISEGQPIRLVTHLDISRENIDYVIEQLQKITAS